jgi:hypothetical protein
VDTKLGKRTALLFLLSHTGKQKPEHSEDMKIREMAGGRKGHSLGGSLNRRQKLRKSRRLALD